MRKARERSGIDYVRFLIAERRRELENLRKRVRPAEFLNCERSLLQAINDLELILDSRQSAAWKEEYEMQRAKDLSNTRR